MPVMTGLSGNEMFCLALKGLSAGELVIGNSVHSLGFVGGIGAGLQSAFGGEMNGCSDALKATRYLAWQPIVAGARAGGANAVVAIETRIMPFKGVHEMFMMGTASRHAGLPALTAQQPVTSDLTCEEMWNL